MLAHHEESTLWAKNIENAMVYSSKDDTGTRKVDGKGNEANAYIQAILDNWDTLPDAMAFVHAHNRCVGLLDICRNLSRYSDTNMCYCV